jgi:hypothetical protein
VQNDIPSARVGRDIDHRAVPRDQPLRRQPAIDDGRLSRLPASRW